MHQKGYSFSNVRVDVAYRKSFSALHLHPYVAVAYALVFPRMIRSFESLEIKSSKVGPEANFSENVAFELELEGVAKCRTSLIETRDFLAVLAILSILMVVIMRLGLKY